MASMFRVLPTFKGYTVDIRLKQFRKMIFGQMPEFINFDSPQGKLILDEYLESNWRHEMELMTEEIEKNFPPLYSTENKEPKDVKIIAKFFCPWNHWIWYATEYDPETGIFFGFVHGDFDEFGNFSLDELQSVRGPFSLGIERDMYFGDHTLADVIEKR